MSASIVVQIWGPSVLERIGAPNLIRQSLSGGDYPAHLHVDDLRHQLYEIMFEGLQTNNTSLLEYATSKLDEYASSGAPVTDAVVRSTAYMAHALNMPFVSKYAKYNSDHARKSFYFATVLEKSLNLPNLDLFDHLCAARHHYDFNIGILDTSNALHQNMAFKMATVLTARNDMQRLKECSELYNWCQEKSTTNSVFIQRMMSNTAQSGATDAFAWILSQFQKATPLEMEVGTKNIIRVTSNACIKHNTMEVFEHLFNSLPQYRKYMFDRLDKFENKQGLRALMPYMERLEWEDLHDLVAEYSPLTGTESDALIKEHAANLLQRQTLAQCVPSSSLRHRRKV